MAAFTRFIAILSFFISFSFAFDVTDTVTWGGSTDRTGYEENHNMDPAVVSSQQFGLLFRTQLPGQTVTGGPEQIFASPLVYTASDGVQYVYIATASNNIYKIHAKNGTIVASRNVGKPFLQSDLGTCTDISPNIGSTATGVIDPATGTWYFSSKTYLDQSPNGATGRPNGRYYIHAVSVEDLSEKPNYPADIEFTVARNNPLRSFTGGIHHQRPGLLQFNNFIYVGFASHCIQYNYTGWIMGIQKDTGSLVEAYAMEGAGVGPTVSGAGVWMSGGGLASNGIDSIYWSTGNGQAGQLDQSPVNGRTPPTSLEEAAVKAVVNSDGTITPVDFFMPWEKKQLDGADKDLGTSPLQLLPSQFSCGSIARIGMVTGKSGKTYWLNMDDMGGYRNGPNRLDNIIQTYQHENSVYAGAGVYPLEGGYVYVNVINYPTRVFQFTCQSGTPYFNPVSTTTEVNAGRLSVGHGSVTSLGQPGTGLLWVSDMDGSNLRIYNAVPDNNGKMTMINSFATPGATKFSKLSFGNGAVYQITSAGYLYAYGSPVNQPLDCQAPSFPPTNLNATSDPQTIQCQAKTAVTVIAASKPSNFGIQLPDLPVQIAAGSNFSFNATFSPTIVGQLSSSLFLNTTGQAQGFTSTTQIQLRGTSQSQNPILAINPPTVTWNGVITGETANQTVVFSNLGNATLSITSIKYSTTSEQGPWVDTNSTANATSVGPFTFYNMPSSLGPNSVYTIPINFNPTVSGGYAVYIRIDSNGGSGIFDTFATGADYPQALLEFETINGTWTAYDNTTSFTFGSVLAGSSRTLRLRLSNVGGPNAAPLSVTVSKPPFGITGSILGAVNGQDLGEGQLVNTGDQKYASMFCAPPRSQINLPAYSNTTTWTMNLNDPNFGHQLIQFNCTAITPQTGPTTNGSVNYQYAGCYKEYNPGRQLQTQLYTSPNNTNELCIANCSAAGWIFAGTQFSSECWCGNNRPLTVVDDANCYYDCSGIQGEICGGNGIDHAGTYISVFGDITRWDGNKTNTVGPYTNPGTNGFTSIGCYTDSQANRTLANRKTTTNATVAACMQACQGYTYAGVEFGGECYCDNSILSSAVPAPLTDCSMVCNGNGTEYCGASSRLDMYQFGLNTTGNVSTSSITSSATTSSTFSTVSYANSTITTTTAASTTASLTTTSSITSSISSSLTTSAASTTQVSNITSQVFPSTVSSTSSSVSLSSSANTTTTSSTGLPPAVNAGTTSSTSSSSTITSSSVSSTLSTTSATSSLSSSSSSSPSSSSSSTVTTSSSAGTTSASSTTSSSIAASTTSSATSSSTTISSTTALTTASTSTTAVQSSSTSSSAGLSYSSSSSASTIPSSLASSTSSIKSTTSSLTATSASTSANTSPSGSATPTPISAASSPTTSSVTTTSALPSTSSGASPTASSAGSPTSTTSSPGQTSSTAATSFSSSTSSSTLSTTVPTSSSFTASLTSTTLFTSLKTSTITTASSTTTSSTTTTTSSTTTSTKFTGTPTIVPRANGYTYSDCYQEATNIRALSAKSYTSTNMTVESCTAFCSGYTYAGVEYGSECYCANKINIGAGAKVATDGRCKQACGGDSRELCGGSYGLNVYTSGLPYVGCAVDQSARTLSGSQLISSPMTIEKCLDFCGVNYPLAGVEYGQECYCGYDNGLTVGASGCSTPCSGNNVETCGGTWRLSVYNNTAYVPPVAKAAIGTYAYKGCYIDGATRILTGGVAAGSTVAQETCVAYCKGKGYKVAGTEYGQECWCGNTVPAASKKTAETDCNMRCAGDSSELCGAGYRLNVWATP